MSDTSAMGIIFPNLHDANVPELTGKRTMASLPFGGRYRMIDFCLSGMANAGMRNIGVVARQNYQSLMDHLGNGSEWDLSRKRGGLVIYPPYGRGDSVYKGRIEALASVMLYLTHRTENLVIMSDCDIASNINYKDLIRSHIDTGADVTVVYKKGEITEGMQRDNVVYNMDDENRVTEIRINDYKKGTQNISMNVYVIGREFLISLVKDAMVRGDLDFERDLLARNLKILKIKGYEADCYCARIYDMQSYFEENLRLLNPANIDSLFPSQRPVYTKVRDEAPVRYTIGSNVTNCMVADGCIIEGELENCMLFRGVRVGKGAKLSNCIILQGSVIEADVQMENVVTDKDVTVCAGQKLRGSQTFPLFISKGVRVQ